MTPWKDLSPAQQLELREAYNASPDCLTGTCSLEVKLARFTEWLAGRGVQFTEDDLRPPRT
ncbi:MAG: hypothetical protein ACP5DX_07235 [Paracoccaceae bacterium]|jgi:hypothetical protein